MKGAPKEYGRDKRVGESRIYSCSHGFIFDVREPWDNKYSTSSTPTPRPVFWGSQWSFRETLRWWIKELISCVVKVTASQDIGCERHLARADLHKEIIDSFHQRRKGSRGPGGVFYLSSLSLSFSFHSSRDRLRAVGKERDRREDNKNAWTASPISF